MKQASFACMLINSCLASGGVSVIELHAGKLIKISQHTSSEDYSALLSQRDATGVIAALLGIVATHRGVQHAPLAMLAACTQVCTYAQLLHNSVRERS